MPSHSLAAASVTASLCLILGAAILFLSPNLITLKSYPHTTPYIKYTIGIFSDSITQYHVHDANNNPPINVPSRVGLNYIISDVCLGRSTMNSRVVPPPIWSFNQSTNPYTDHDYFCPDIDNNCVSTQTEAIIMAATILLSIICMATAATLSEPPIYTQVLQHVLHITATALYIYIAATLQSYTSTCRRAESNSTALPYVWSLIAMSSLAYLYSISTFFVIWYTNFNLNPKTILLP
jgi:hypothetical protein